MLCVGLPLLHQSHAFLFLASCGTTLDCADVRNEVKADWMMAAALFNACGRPYGQSVWIEEGLSTAMTSCRYLSGPQNGHRPVHRFALALRLEANT